VYAEVFALHAAPRSEFIGRHTDPVVEKSSALGATRGKGREQDRHREGDGYKQANRKRGRNSRSPCRELVYDDCTFLRVEGPCGYLSEFPGTDFLI
jgi:hypothetical protein